MGHPLAKLEKDILEAINFYRGLVLDSVEYELGSDDQRWRYIRSRLLKCLGDRGLHGKVLEKFSEHKALLKIHKAEV